MKAIASFDHGLKKEGAIGLTDDGAYALAQDDFTRLALFDLKAKKAVRQWRGHGSGRKEGRVNGVVQIKSVPGRHVFATSDFIGYVRFWDVEGKKVGELSGLGQPATVTSFSDDGKLLATGGARKPIVLWDVEKILPRK